MATHSSIFAWRIPMDPVDWGLQSIGLQRVGHNCRTEHAHMTQFTVGAPQGFWDLSHFASWVHVSVCKVRVLEHSVVHLLRAGPVTDPGTHRRSGSDHPCPLGAQG